MLFNSVLTLYYMNTHFISTNRTNAMVGDDGNIKQAQPLPFKQRFK